MDWARAVDINRVALSHIVAELIAMLGVVSGAVFERMLRPAESALRRLIVIAARGLVVKPRVSRPMSKDLVIASNDSRRKNFQLFDPRKSFDFNASENPYMVLVKTWSSNPYAAFANSDQRPLVEQACVDLLQKRLVLLQHALETLPLQAKRLARWKAKRLLLEKVKFKSPLRPGRPPGFYKEPSKQVDLVLRECHGLAWDVLREESS